ncbi:aminotransferase class IV [Methylobrevis pamukkalensis]|uniref:Probable branched-chain-amino-acid aminotransferase n=1 Tax=Methylobrevis pamukkalensis TaxID=1439726 RepID=A0A1E3H3D7_9HYPH|nr:aminotransferase class IV [Methylobrevis pamukkalensis]ODN70839.1 Aminodeoxychorismate lyase [Methylobrevis pamukkalensis]
MIWLDGTFHEGPTVQWNVADRGLLLADGLFETAVVFDGRIFCLAEHLARLGTGARLLGFEAPLDLAEEGMQAVARFAPPSGGVIRLTVTRGAGPRGLAPPAEPVPTVLATVAPFDPSLVFRKVSLQTAGVRRNEHSPLSRVKSLAYMDNVLAIAEAKAAGADDALILNTAGRPVCTSAANLFVVRKGEIATPPVSDGVLPGVMRGRLMSIAARAGLDVVERSLGVMDIARAEEIFLTNSVRFVQPVTAIDGVDLPREPAVAVRVLDLFRGLLEFEVERGLPETRMQ